MDAAAIVDLLERAEPGARCEIGAATDQPTIYVPREHLVGVCRALRDGLELGFSFLADLTAIDWLPREPRFEVVYHLACLGLGRAAAARLRIKVRVPGDDARVATVSAIWPCANWLEREVWDLFGIVFEDHPDLRRLLMPDDWEGHPLRKDYPVQINLAVKVYEPLQVTQEEFVRNIEASRVRTGKPRPSGGAAPE